MHRLSVSILSECGISSNHKRQGQKNRAFQKDLEGLNLRYTVSLTAVHGYEGPWVPSEAVLGNTTSVPFLCGHRVSDNPFIPGH